MKARRLARAFYSSNGVSERFMLGEGWYHTFDAGVRTDMFPTPCRKE